MDYYCLCLLDYIILLLLPNYYWITSIYYYWTTVIGLLSSNYYWITINEYILLLILYYDYKFLYFGPMFFIWQPFNLCHSIFNG